MHARKVYWDTRTGDEQSHPNFDWPDIERHEDQEGADDDEYDGNNQVELD